MASVAVRGLWGFLIIGFGILLTPDRFLTSSITRAKTTSPKLKQTLAAAEDFPENFPGPGKLASDMVDAASQYLFYTYGIPRRFELVLRRPFFAAVFAFCTDIRQVNNTATSSLIIGHAESKARIMTTLRDWVARTCADDDKVKELETLVSFHDFLILSLTTVERFYMPIPHKERVLPRRSRR